MPTPNEIGQQAELLIIYRNNLAQYLQQQAQIGAAYVAPNIVNGIREARNQIRRIKVILRQWGVQTTDHPDDEGLMLSQISDDNSEVSITIERIISQSSPEQIILTSDSVIQSLQRLKYDNTVVEDFRFVFHELTQNALEHGCQNESDSFKVLCIVMGSCVTITVTNPPGRLFNITALLAKSQIKFRKNPGAKRGRGLLLVSEVADTIAGSGNNGGIKAILYQDKVKFDVKQQDQVVTIEIQRGLYNPSLKRRLFAEASKHLQFHLMLDFSQWYSPNTVSQQAILEIEELFAQTQRRIVALIPRSRNVVLPYTSVAYSREEALNKLLFGRNRTCAQCGCVPPFTAKFCAQCGTMLSIYS